VKLASGTAVPPGPLEDALKRELDGLVASVVLVGHKRRSLGVLFTLQVRVAAHSRSLFFPADSRSHNVVGGFRPSWTLSTTPPIVSVPLRRCAKPCPCAPL
jgi:hypothetical protein